MGVARKIFWGGLKFSFWLMSSKISILGNEVSKQRSKLNSLFKKKGSYANFCIFHGYGVESLQKFYSKLFCETFASS